MTRLEENGRRTGCSGTRSTQMAVRWCITARRNSNALSIRPAANSTDSLPKVSSERLSYPQIPRTRQSFRPRPVGAELQPPAETLVDLRLQRIVISFAATACGVDGAVSRDRPDQVGVVEARSLRRRVEVAQIGASGGRPGRVRRDAIAIHMEEPVMHNVPDVGQVDHHSLAQVMLD